MTTSDNLHVIIGLGATGLSCARFLRRRGLNVAVNDTREKPPHLAELTRDYPEILVSLGKLDGVLLSKAARIILSPGIAKSESLIVQQIKKGTPVIGDIELFAENVKVPVIAITGTNAKSTVTTLVGTMAEKAGFKVAIGGNLGIPVLDLLHDHTNANLFVLELSSFQLETTYSLQPQVACVLNISPDHMDRYNDLHAYQQAKLRIYHHCQTAVSNKDDTLTECHTPVKEKLYFTLNSPNANTFGLLTENESAYLAFNDQCLMATKELPVLGKHYQANALAALAIGHGLHMPFADMVQVLREFKGLPHRCQFVRELNGVKWFNDSKGTNVGATLAAIDGLGRDMFGKMVLIAGGIGKNADFSPLLPVIERHARHIVLIGEAAQEIAAVIHQRIPISFANSMEEAIIQAFRVAQSDDYVLLSPACASFDMFKNFEHRGEVFMEIVEKLECGVSGGRVKI